MIILKHTVEELASQCHRQEELLDLHLTLSVLIREPLLLELELLQHWAASPTMSRSAKKLEAQMCVKSSSIYMLRPENLA